MPFNVSNAAGHLQTILGNHAPGTVESLRAKSERKNTPVEDILKKESDRIDRIVKRSASLQSFATEYAKNGKANSKPSRINIISMGGWGVTLIGQSTGLIVGWSNSSVVSKIMQSFTIGSTLATGIITGIVYWKHFRQKNLAENRAEEAGQLGDIEAKFNFIMESKLLADNCLNPVSASSVKDQYYSLKGKINHALKTSDVTKQFCAAWIEAEPMIKELRGDGKSEKLQIFVNEKIMKIIRDLAKENEELLNNFRELSKQEQDVDHFSEATERIKKLIDETITLRETKEKKVASAEDSSLNTIYAHYAPVGTWIITIGGQVAAFVDDCGSSTPGTKVIELATILAGVLTGVITGVVYMRYFKKEDIKNLGGVVKGANSAESVKKDSVTAHIYAQFLEQAHNLGKKFAEEGHDQKQLKHDYKQLREFMTHHQNTKAIPNHLYNQWMAFGRHVLTEKPILIGNEVGKIKKEAKKDIYDTSNEISKELIDNTNNIIMTEIEEKKEEMLSEEDEFLEKNETLSSPNSFEEVWPEGKLQLKALDRLLPRIHREAKHFDQHLSKIELDEQQEWKGYRSYWPFRWIWGNAEIPHNEV